MIKKCKGCGILLQTDNQNKLGYTKDYNNELCERCFKLKNYGEYYNVKLNNTNYKEILNKIPNSSLIVYITSILNINFNYIDNFKNVLIVLTKRDLLPKSIKETKLINYIKSHVDNYIDIEVVSSEKNYNIDNLYEKIKKYGKDKEIYFVGMTNSGKSTLINRLISNYTDDSAKLTTSIYPSTTLDKVYINIDNVKIIDTPGLLSEKTILNKLELKEIKKITPKKEIKPKIYQIKRDTSLLIGDLIRIEIHGIDNIVFYLANNLRINNIGKDNNILKDGIKYNFKLEKNKDIVIEDLCFIKFKENISVDIFCKYDINIYTRDNLI